MSGSSRPRATIQPAVQTGLFCTRRPKTTGQPASAPIRRVRVLVATATRPRTVIDISLRDRRRERPRCPVSRFGRAGPARQTHGDPTYLIAADEYVHSGSDECSQVCYTTADALTFASSSLLVNSVQESCRYILTPVLSVLAINIWYSCGSELSSAGETREQLCSIVGFTLDSVRPVKAIPPPAAEDSAWGRLEAQINRMALRATVISVAGSPSCFEITVAVVCRSQLLRTISLVKQEPGGLGLR